MDADDDDPVILTLGERIRLWRSRRGLTQKELAGRVGVSPKSMLRYEADAVVPPADILRNIAVSLEISADYVLGLSETAVVAWTTSSPEPTGEQT